MKRRLVVGLCTLALLLVAAPGLAWAGGHGHYHGGGHYYGHGYYGHGYYGGWYGGPRFYLGIGPGFWWGPWAWGPGFYPPAYYAPPAYAPPVVVQQPQVYVQRPSAPTGWWYYCPSAGEYYPNVPSCPEAWVKVPPRAD